MSDFDSAPESRGDVFDLPQMTTDVDEEPGDFGHSMNFSPSHPVEQCADGDKKMEARADESRQDNFDELPTSYQTFIHRSKYARYRDDLGRRETWSETVDRYVDFFNEHLKNKCGYSMTAEDRADVRNAIGKLQVMPSMRALMTAGPALARDNIAGYNCAFVAVDDQRAFDEILYVLMNGTGVGFSVERQYVTGLPTVPEFKPIGDKHVIHVGDSKEGWAFALQQLFSFLYHGIVPTWDLSALRPAGARLMTFGGRSSGPKPLDELFKFIVAMFKNAQGRKLQSIEVHDIVCKIAEIVVVGGVRRSALISLSNLSDDRMRSAKSGEWWKENPHRALANNSVAYTEKPEIGRFMKEWISLYESKSGERGLFNRIGCQNHIRKTCPNRNPNKVDGLNPCAEIILRNHEFCNLSEVVVRTEDTPDTLKEKVRIATILGTWQSSLTDFQYISERWKKNCEEEHLLGVSLTGIMDNEFMSGTYDAKRRAKSSSEVECAASWPLNEPASKRARLFLDAWAGQTLPEFLEELKCVAIETNRIWAKKLNIDVSAAITTVKPSGTVSQLVDSASGIHTRHAKYYIRTVRSDRKDPMTKFLQDEGVPWEPCAMKPNDTVVFSFPIKAPDVCITRDDRTVLQQLEICKIYNEHWCQHNVSVTINVKEPEWMRVGSWIWDNFDTTSGISFLPHSEHTYQQAPYQECDEAAYLAMAARMPTINWKKLRRYESTDMTTGAKELACTAGGCEL
jgi:ribonucleoside-triphosphate reductase (thioredoxin)